MPAFFLHLSPVALLAIQALEPDCSLKMGDRSRDVQKLQLFLKEAGFYQGALDGFFALGTQQGLSRCQRHLKLPTTGELDIATWYELTYWTEEHFAQPQTVAA